MVAVLHEHFMCHSGCGDIHDSKLIPVVSTVWLEGRPVYDLSPSTEVLGNAF